ncbi:hypothetical protein ACXYMU_19270 [Pontibacter sp. CAU 1760]
MKEETTPPAPNAPSSGPFAPKCPLNPPFDVSPLLQAVMAEDGPLGMADSLDQAYTTLAEYLASDPNNAGQHNAHLLYVLRRMRDALLQGAGRKRR